MTEREKMIQLSRVFVPITGPDEDRACQAVAFAWSWTDFPIESIGSPQEITFQAANPEDWARFDDEFVPALNADLVEAGFKPITSYRSSKKFWDLDDPNDSPGMMRLIPVLVKNGWKRADLRALTKTETGRAEIRAKARELNGRFLAPSPYTI